MRSFSFVSFFLFFHIQYNFLHKSRLCNCIGTNVCWDEKPMPSSSHIHLHRKYFLLKLCTIYYHIVCRYICMYIQTHICRFTFMKWTLMITINFLNVVSSFRKLFLDTINYIIKYTLWYSNCMQFYVRVLWFYICYNDSVDW